MTPEKIKAKRIDLEGKIDVTRRRLRGLESKLGGLREQCSHPSLKQTTVMGDYYSKWYAAYRCPDCGFHND